MASTRRLAAILAADVAGYSRLMGADEEGTHKRLKSHLDGLVDPKISEHQGRVVKTTGDGLLAEFASVVDALRYRLRGDRLGEVMVTTPPDLPLPDKPSIVVLPFQNMSSDAEQEYFADGMVEEIITALSRIRWLFVIARNSSFTYKGQAIDVKQVGGELGVRYVLEGSVRKALNRVRITGQLIEAESGAHLWAERFDGSLEDVFDLQDQVATSVAGVIEPELQAAEIRRSSNRPTDDLSAYDLYLRALQYSQSADRKGIIDWQLSSIRAMEPLLL